MKIAVSGPAASGKGTIARRFAVEAGIEYIDLGLLFRLGAFALGSGKIHSLEVLPRLIRDGSVSYLWNEEQAIITWHSEDITSFLLSQEVARQTSVLASDSSQQKILTTVANLVLHTFEDVICDGRNAGTTILPNADYKFFVTARLEERARRRYLDILARGGVVSYEDILREINERDKRDAERATYPLIVPEGAVILETDARSVEASIRFMWDIIRIKS